MSKFHPFDVVDRGSETQLKVGENLNYLIQRFDHYSGGIDFRRQNLKYRPLPALKEIKIFIMAVDP